MISCHFQPRLPWGGTAAMLRALLLAVVALLAGCGGGTEQNEPFVPVRLFTLGDEASTINPDGTTYSVNGLDANGNFDCTALPIWTESLATNLGFVFAECNKASVADPKARSLAAPHAKAADITAQVDAALAAAGRFGERDLTTVFVGVNDVMELYEQYPQSTEAALMAEAARRGVLVAQQVNRLIALGTKVIVVNLPDLGYTPFAIKEKQLYSDTDRAALLSHLVAAFNQNLGVSILLDGRYVGLVQLDQRSQVLARAGTSFGFTDVIDPVCAVALPGCTTATLVPGGTAKGYLWADDRWFAPGGQAQLALLAIDRARNNPF
ncbi:MAG TPA: SGNH/GDSL hydrolase family protein [Rubrivivax sp.]|nr:SGNH/GDSL hydrolase family protein [Rubrivivax sp.]